MTFFMHWGQLSTFLSLKHYVASFMQQYVYISSSISLTCTHMKHLLRTVSTWWRDENTSHSFLYCYVSGLPWERKTVMTFSRFPHVFIYSNLLCARTEIFPGYSYRLVNVRAKKDLRRSVCGISKIRFLSVNVGDRCALIGNYLVAMTCASAYFWVLLGLIVGRE